MWQTQFICVLCYEKTNVLSSLMINPKKKKKLDQNLEKEYHINSEHESSIFGLMHVH